MINFEENIKKLMQKIAYKQDEYKFKNEEIFNILAWIEYDLHEILKGEFEFESNK